MAANEWYYTVNGQQSTAPVSPAYLKQLAQAGQLQPTDLVWKEGMANWVPASSLKGLFSASAAPAPMPAPAPTPSYAGYPGAEGGEAVQVRPARSGGGNFVPGMLRAFAWNLSASTVTPGEKAQLEAQGVSGETAQRYLTWRRSFLFATAVPTLIAAVLATINLVAGFKILGGIGSILLALYLVSLYGLSAVALVTAFLWTKPRLGRVLLLAAWSAAFAMPLILVLSPAKWKTPDKSSLIVSATANPSDPQKMMEQIKKLQEAMKDAVTTLLVLMLGVIPALLTVAPGFIRGGLRIKTLAPGTVAPGWVVFLSALFFALILFITVLELIAKPYEHRILLLLGLVFLLLAPLVYFARGSLFVRPLPREKVSSLIVMQWAAFGLAALGGILAAIFVLLDKPGIQPAMARPSMQEPPPGMQGMDFRPGRGPGAGRPPISLGKPAEEPKKDEGPSIILPAMQLYADYLGRSLFTSILVADFLLGAVVLGWRNQQRLAKSPDGPSHEKSLTELESLTAPAR